MKIYLAGKFADSQDIHRKMNILKGKNFMITHDWTQIEKAEDDRNKKRRCAILDINGVKNCDVLVVLLTDPDYPYQGTFTEIGCALGLDRTVIVMCPNEEMCHKSMTVFLQHPNITVTNSWDDCVEILERWRLSLLG